jgi:dTDP-4-amino-4,6-dideoxygalactose transaminase
MCSEKLNVPFNRPKLQGQELRFIQEAVEKGQLSGDGYFTEKCSELITNQTRSKYCLLTHSCTAALEMAAILCDISHGDEVIMPSYTFVSTANAVVLRGGVPVFVDVEETSMNINCKEVKQAITSKTKAIFAVHYGGFMADMDQLSEICSEHNILLVEDAAQAFGSSFAGKPAGSFGDLAAFSFHETKNIISGEGGALTLNNQTLIDRAQIIRQKGTNRNEFLNGKSDKYTWVDIGSSFLPGELISAFLYGQLQNHHKIKMERLSIFKRYEDSLLELQNLGKIRLVNKPKKQSGNGHLFYILLTSRSERDKFIEHMRVNNILCPFHYVPLHSSPAGLIYGRAFGEMNVTNYYSSRLVRLPLYSGLQENNVFNYVIEKVYEFFGY